MRKFNFHDQGLADLFDAALDSGPPKDEAIAHPGLRHASECGFKPTAKIGEGGMGEAWFGTDCNTGRSVATKVPHADNPAAIAMLEREAQTLADLHPPHVAALIRTGGENQTRFIVLEYIDGPTLIDHINQVKGSVERVIQAMLSTCKAVAYVHEKGYLHGDIKPSNLLVRTDGSVVLIDFGLSTRIGHNGTRILGPNYRGGTERFAAPETRGKSSTGNTVASDVYSLGATFQSLIEEADLPALPALSRVLDRATDEDPAKRFQSVNELHDALQAVLARRTAKKSARTRFAQYAAAAAIVLLVTLLVPLLINWNRATTPTEAGSDSIARAVAMLGDGAPDAAAEVLQQVPVGERAGWEWRHLWTRATAPPAVARQTFDHPGMSSAAGLDGQHFAVGLPTGEVVLHHETAPPISLFKKEGRWVTHLYATPAGFLALYDSGEVFELANDGQTLRSGHVEVEDTNVLWPTDATDAWVAVRDSDRSVVSVLDLDDNRVLLQEPAAFAIPAVSTPGWVLMSRTGPHGGSLTVDIVEGAFNARRTIQMADWEYPLCFDVDLVSGRAIIGTTDGRVLIYDIDGDGAPSVYRSEGDGVTAITMDPREDRVFLATDEQLEVFQLSTGKLLLKLPIEIKGIVNNIRWVPETGTLAVVTDFGWMTWRAPPKTGNLALH